MNAPQTIACPIEDVQSLSDDRQIPIRKVGIKAIRHPLVWGSGTDAQPTVASFDLYVSLPADQKGTHMSRFVAILNERVAELDTAGFRDLLQHTRERLESDTAFIRARMPYFVRKAAPVSGIESWLDYELAIEGSTELTDGVARDLVELEVQVPVTSLCPCSKKISKYGAHNQRSHVTVRVEVLDDTLSVQRLISLVEREASSELYGLLKRTDEKLVTEHAYEHPKFVEDLVRDVAGALAKTPGVGRYLAVAENFESIHNHSAYAEVEGDARNA